MKAENVYNTTDPQKLLELKRLEADALLDVLRTINHEGMTIRNLCLIVRNTLRAQLGVRKMAIFYLEEDTWQEGARLGFKPFAEESVEEMVEQDKMVKVDPVTLPQLSKRAVEYVIPVNHYGEVVASFAIADFADSPVEAENDLIFIETIGNILAVAIQNRNLIKEKVAQEFLTKELEVASQIQEQLMISDFSRFSELDIFGLNKAHHGVGGDFFDVVKKDNGNIFLCIADVSGKGIGAALLMANLQASFRSLCAQYNDLDIIVKELNRSLYHIVEGDKFVTLFVVRVEIDSHTFAYINAGHNYPILFQGEEISRLEKGCMLLGILPEVEVQETILPFHRDDVLFMFTDGVVEQTNGEEEMFGSERIIEELKRIRNFAAQEIVSHLEKELMNFADGHAVTDDVTMLSVKF
ncbi:MAG: PP2C family protein-serine/threonine phosphatase [Bacteroidota bacterium]